MMEKKKERKSQGVKKGEKIMCRSQTPPVPTASLPGIRARLWLTSHPRPSSPTLRASIPTPLPTSSSSESSGKWVFSFLPLCPQSCWKGLGCIQVRGLRRRKPPRRQGQGCLKHLQDTPILRRPGPTRPPRAGLQPSQSHQPLSPLLPGQPPFPPQPSMNFQFSLSCC